ncbi:MAG: hypothetical protein WD767_11800 [Alphaproteobacteria bacterium]
MPEYLQIRIDVAMPAQQDGAARMTPRMRRRLSSRWATTVT